MGRPGAPLRVAAGVQHWSYPRCVLCGETLWGALREAGSTAVGTGQRGSHSGQRCDASSIRACVKADDQHSLSGGAVEEFSCCVGVASMTCGLVNQVQQDPTQIGSVLRVPGMLREGHSPDHSVCGRRPVAIGG